MMVLFIFPEIPAIFPVRGKTSRHRKAFIYKEKKIFFLIYIHFPVFPCVSILPSSIGDTGIEIGEYRENRENGNFALKAAWLLGLNFPPCVGKRNVSGKFTHHPPASCPFDEWASGWEFASGIDEEIIMIKTPCFDWSDTLKAAQSVGFISSLASSDDVEERAQFAAELGTYIWDTYENDTPSAVAEWYRRDVACTSIGEWFFTSQDGGIKADLAVKYQGSSIPADELWAVVNNQAA